MQRPTLKTPSASRTGSRRFFFFPAEGGHGGPQLDKQLKRGDLAQRDAAFKGAGWQSQAPELRKPSANADIVHVEVDEAAHLHNVHTHEHGVIRQAIARRGAPAPRPLPPTRPSLPRFAPMHAGYVRIVRSPRNYGAATLPAASKH